MYLDLFRVHVDFQKAVIEALNSLKSIIGNHICILQDAFIASIKTRIRKCSLGLENMCSNNNNFSIFSRKLDN